MRVEVLYFSTEVEAKQWKKHKLTQHDIEEALLREGTQPRFDRHPWHGFRALVKTETTSGDDMIVWLAPIYVTSGLWSVITAYIVERGWG